jgi:DNA-binding beta-propeller fold protein YncE
MSIELHRGISVEHKIRPVQHLELHYSHTIGRSDFSGPSFRSPVDIARGEGDVAYVVSRATEPRPDGKRITMFTLSEDYITEFGKGYTPSRADRIAEDGAMVWPTAIAVDREDGNVYLADGWLNRITVFSSDGDFVSKWGTQGSAEGEISYPAGLAFNSQNELVVVDGENHRVQKFSKDGRFISSAGTHGTGDGEFNMPWGVAVDKDDNIYVADWSNDRIQKLGADGSFQMSIGSSGDGEGEFRRPSDVAVDGDGFIYVTDWGNDRLEVFDRAGEFVTARTGDATMSKWGTEKLNANPEMWEIRKTAQGMEREKMFWSPVAVEVDDANRVFVVEASRSRVQIYMKQVPFFFEPGRL